MKNNCRKVLLSAALLIVTFCLSACGKEKARTIKVESVSGITTVSSGSDSVEAFEGQMLLSGDKVNVSSGAELMLLLDKDKHAYAKNATKFSLVAEGSAANSQTSFYVEEGRLIFGVDNKLKDGEVFEVSTPNATMAVRGTVFDVEVRIEDGDYVTRLAVVEGTVHCETMENGQLIEYNVEAGDDSNFYGTVPDSAGFEIVNDNEQNDTVFDEGEDFTDGQSDKVADSSNVSPNVGDREQYFGYGSGIEEDWPWYGSVDELVELSGTLYGTYEHPDYTEMCDKVYAAKSSHPSYFLRLDEPITVPDAGEITDIVAGNQSPELDDLFDASVGKHITVVALVGKEGMENQMYMFGSEYSISIVAIDGVKDEKYAGMSK